MGALPMRMEAGVHDHAVAAISHLPHAVATALSVLAAEQDGGVLSRLAAGGFKDITRIASASPSLWTGICLQSAPALLPVLDAFSGVLERFRTAIGSGDAASLRSLFEAGAAYRAGLPTAGHGALESYATLKIQIPDQPGAVAGVASPGGQRDQHPQYGHYQCTVV
jgi:prephenate dehydrogenase